MSWNWVTKPAVAAVDQRDVSLKTCQVALKGLGAAAERIPLGDQALNCARRGEEYELDVLVGAVRARLRAGLVLRLAHHAAKLHGRCAGVSAKHVSLLEWGAGMGGRPRNWRCFNVVWSLP